jgi:hypothetical protein
MRLPYVQATASPASLMPRLPMNLSYGNESVEVVGLLDTGSSVNVLPYGVGLALGAIWDEQRFSVPLVGSLGRFEARGLVVMASHPRINPDNPVRLVCAWTRAEDAPVLFGQSNFFMEFDVCFYGSQNTFEINLKRAQ